MRRASAGLVVVLTAMIPLSSCTLEQASSPRNGSSRAVLLKHPGRRSNSGWQATGMSPADTESWQQAGFSARDAGRWERVGATPAQAKRWERRGLFFGDYVGWQRAGFSPASALIWEAAVGNDPHTAALWRAKGVPPTTARKWLRRGVRTPTEAAHEIRLARQKYDAALAAYRQALRVYRSTIRFEKADRVILRDECPKGVVKMTWFVFHSRNPYDLIGFCLHSGAARIFQVLSQHSALIEAAPGLPVLIPTPGSNLLLHLESLHIPPRESLRLSGLYPVYPPLRVTGVFKYTTALGIIKIIPTVVPVHVPLVLLTAPRRPKPPRPPPWLAWSRSVTPKTPPGGGRQ